MLTPLETPNGQQEEAHNRSHIKTRNSVERAFGVLKKRFPCIGRVVRTKVNTTKAIIVTAVVLHNLAVATRVVQAEDDIEPQHVDEEQHVYHPENGRENIVGLVVRRELIHQHFLLT